MAFTFGSIIVIVLVAVLVWLIRKDRNTKKQKDTVEIENENITGGDTGTRP